MSSETTTDHPETNASETTRSREEFVARLREQTTAVRLRRAVFGNTRTLTREQLDEIADRYQCDRKSLRAKKVLLNRKLDRVHRCYKVVEACIAYWKANTVPYSAAEKGIRLIRRDLVPQFEATMTQLIDDLANAVADADDHYHDEILSEARERLAELYDASDYPSSLVGHWRVDWEYPNVEPPEYLQQLNPELYAAEQRRIQARFAEALQAAEDSIAHEFGKMLAKLAERLTPDEDGKPKTFQKSSLENLQTFFDRFSHLSIGSNAQLDRLVDEAKGLLSGRTSEELRKNGELRETVAEQVENIYSRVSEFIVDRPERGIDLESVE